MIWIARLFSYLPLGLLYILADILSLLAYYVIRYRKSVVFKNLNRSFPQSSKKKIRSIARKFYRNLTDIIVETVKGLRITKQEILERVSFTNTDILEHYIHSGQSMILVTIHQCNWEWLLLAGSAKFDLQVGAIYQPLTNKKVDAFMYNLRSRFGGKPIPLQNLMPEMMARLKQGVHGFALVADQVPGRDAKKYWATFLNQETAFFVGPQQLAKLAKIPVLFMGMKRIKRGFYEVSFESIGEPPYAKNDDSILENFVKRSEQLILANPHEWLWSHKRWKYKRPIYE